MKKNIPIYIMYLLLALGACSCTTDADLLPADPGQPGITTPQAPIRISVAPRPAYREVNLDGTPADTLLPPATRVVQTETGSKWEDGDVIWLRAEYTYQDGTAFGTTTVSALIYDNGKWRSFDDTEYDKCLYSNANIAPRFERELRWPEEVLKDADADGKCTLRAAYVGNEVPIDGVIAFTEPHKVDYMTALITFRPGQTANLQFEKKYMRIYITEPFSSNDLVLKVYSGFEILSHFWTTTIPTTLSNPSSGYYFGESITSNPFTVNGIPVTLQPDGNGNYAGLSYTIDPAKLKNGPVAPE